MQPLPVMSSYTVPVVARDVNLPWKPQKVPVSPEERLPARPPPTGIWTPALLMEMLISQPLGFLGGYHPSLPAPHQVSGTRVFRACTFWAETAIHVMFFTQAADLQM